MLQKISPRQRFVYFSARLIEQFVSEISLLRLHRHRTKSYEKKGFTSPTSCLLIRTTIWFWFSACQKLERDERKILFFFRPPMKISLTCYYRAVNHFQLIFALRKKHQTSDYRKTIQWIIFQWIDFGFFQFGKYFLLIWFVLMHSYL